MVPLWRKLLSWRRVMATQISSRNQSDGLLKLVDEIVGMLPISRVETSRLETTQSFPREPNR